MKRLLTYLFLSALLSSCNTLRQAFRPVAPSVSDGSSAALRFIDPIEIKSAEKNGQSLQQSTSGRSSLSQIPGTQWRGYGPSEGMDGFSPLQFKYAMRMDVPVENVDHLPLYNFIEEWWGTPYRLGGSTRTGIDCSAFVQTLMLGVFSLQLPRTSREQKTYAQQIDDKERKEGDLVFFSNSRSGVITHVGIYLHNNKFVHASTSNGVIISDLTDDYWSKRYRGSGRVMPSLSAMHP